MFSIKRILSPKCLPSLENLEMTRLASFFKIINKITRLLSDDANVFLLCVLCVARFVDKVLLFSIIPVFENYEESSFTIYFLIPTILFCKRFYVES